MRSFSPVRPHQLNPLFSILLHPDNSQHRLPAPPSSLPRVLFSNRCAHRYRLHANTTVVRTFPLPSGTLSYHPDSPETILVFRSILPFENLYLTRSTNRLNEAVSSSFSITSSLSASFSSRPPSVPTANEGLSAARAVVNELDAARFDPLLVKAVARGAAQAMEMFVERAEALVSCPLDDLDAGANGRSAGRARSLGDIPPRSSGDAFPAFERRSC